MVVEMKRGMLDLPDEKWAALNFSWVLFFLIAGGLNIYVAYMYSEATWVKFKLFGLIGLTVVFIVGQSFWLAKQINESSSE